MVLENDNGAIEPLLRSGRVKLPSSAANVAYGRNSGEQIERDEIYETKSRPLRESYINQLGYTPLIFKVNREYPKVEC
ncbi:hypothetical protein KXD40_003416 [Peronospora effusa]|uniref:Uncharacterized protein n=1 Tax=Peronospora effusa TaxID=542832 RepID=A0A3M6VEH4_9STRA|nr:hypothetical protein DD238_005127 [Peronospora effusa]RQM17746.1 hypothetical protein DD237_001179 [Peronospora effusa]UIZ29387.1 hypothetical protein KXD40_003416 [Peronospora effusa]